VNGAPLKPVTSDQFYTVSVVARGLRWRLVVASAWPPDRGDAKMNISGESLLVILAIGITAGWLAGQVV